ncbi:hypothetical protein FJ977_04750 [Mesorhizobium sp. B2-1-3A]|nr:hypothetical protein FJ977_04750 [Mesorhizobium sp. B2-1-3A]
MSKLLPRRAGEGGRSGRLMHVAQNCVRFWENDMHKTTSAHARRFRPLFKARSEPTARALPPHR